MIDVIPRCGWSCHPSTVWLTARAIVAGQDEVPGVLYVPMYAIMARIRARTSGSVFSVSGFSGGVLPVTFATVNYA